MVACRAPWLNPIEPKWLHGKRAVAEPDAVLDEIELMARVLGSVPHGMHAEQRARLSTAQFVEPNLRERPFHRWRATRQLEGRIPLLVIVHPFWRATRVLEHFRCPAHPLLSTEVP